MLFLKKQERQRKRENSSRSNWATQVLDGPLIYVVAHANPQYSETFGPPFRRSPPRLPPPAPRLTIGTVQLGYHSDLHYSSCLLPVKDAFCQPQTRETGLYGDRGTPTPGDHRNRAQDTESREA